MKIVLTGGTGYIGRYVASRLEEEGYDMHYIVRPTSDTSVLQGQSKVHVLQDNKDLYILLDRIRPDVVVHIAGMFVGEHTEDTIQPLIASNIEFPTILLDAAISAGCSKIINTSSYWQYYESRDYSPVNLYAATKQALEVLAKYYVEAKGMSMVDLMLFDVYGPEDRRRKVLNLVAALEDGEHMAMSPGDQKMFFCYIDDVVDAYIRALDVVRALDAGKYVKYAVRDEKPIRLKDFIELYLEVAGKCVELLWGERSHRPREIMNPENIGEVLDGWSPKCSVREGLMKYVEGGNADGNNTGR